MRRTGFRQQSIEEIRDKQAIKRERDKLKPRNTPQRAKTAPGRVKTKKTAITKSPKKGYQVPSWFKSIPLGSHGNTPTQKRYWKVVSDFVRQRDHKVYKGKCVSCSRTLERWQDMQAAHFKPWSVCNSYFKFNPLNLAGSCSICNYHSGADVGHAFGVELRRRHGGMHLFWIEKENLKYRGQKLEDMEMVKRVEELMHTYPWFILP